MQEAAIRYKRLGYIALNVSDLARSRAFLTDIAGLDEVGPGTNGEILFRCSPNHHDIILHQDADPGLRRVGWEMESSDALEILARRLKDEGLALHLVDAATLDAQDQEAAYRFRDPFTGSTIEIYAARHGEDFDFRQSLAKIQRLGHFVVTVPDADAAVRFYTEVMNFRISDSVPDVLTFMRCFPNPFHHSFGVAQGGVAKGERASLHHVNFMVSEIDDIGRGLVRFRKNDVPIVYGPGRHPPSDSIFLYFLDPDRLTLEYSFGMEEFAEIGPRPARVLPMNADTFDYWGNVPLEGFAARGSIVGDV